MVEERRLSTPLKKTIAIFLYTSGGHLGGREGKTSVVYRGERGGKEGKKEEGGVRVLREKGRGGPWREKGGGE